MAFTYHDARYDDLYRRWRNVGDAVFDERSSTVLQEALKNHAGEVQYRALSHTYRHLDPLLEERRSRRQGVEEGDHRANPLSTPSSTTAIAENTTHAPH